MTLIVGSALPAATLAANSATGVLSTGNALLLAAAGPGVCIATAVTWSYLQKELNHQQTTGKTDLEIARKIAIDSRTRIQATFGLGAVVAAGMGENAYTAGPLFTGLVAGMTYNAVCANKAVERLEAAANRELREDGGTRAR
jgi:uncharacterized membrane protein